MFMLYVLQISMFTDVKSAGKFQGTVIKKLIIIQRIGQILFLSLKLK